MRLSLKITNTILFFSLVIISLSIIIGLMYFTFYCKNPVVFNSRPSTNKLVYRPGEYLTYKMDVCKYTDSPFRLLRSWRDGLVYDSITLYGTGGTMGCKISYHKIKVPDLPTGDHYVLHLSYSYRVGPLLTRYVRTETNEFSIIE